MDPAVARPAVDDPHPLQFRPLCSFHPAGGTRPGFAVPFHTTPPSCEAASQPPVKSRQTRDDCPCHAILPRRHGTLMSVHQTWFGRSIAGASCPCIATSKASIGPVGLGHEVVQGLMRGAHLGRIDTGCDRLDTLTLQRQQEPHRILAKGLITISVAKRCHQTLRVGVEPPACGHHSTPEYSLSSNSYGKK